MNALRCRQIHLDFHTSPHIEGVGSDFDAEHWKSTLRQARVDSVTLFATCHHGHAYHDTEVGERHPHLGFDLLRAQVGACHQIGVRTPIYLTAGLNDWAAAKNPAWREMAPDGRYAGWAKSPLEPGFQKMCFNTPYLELLCRQIEEVCERFPDGHGIFLDIISQGPCCCPWCLASMRANGLNAADPADRASQAQASLLRYHQATTAAARKRDPRTPVFHNSGHLTRGDTGILRFFSHLELESLPTGGWGYDHFPLSARYAAQLPFEVVGMTGKFHTTWGEFGGLKTPDALRYECAAMMAHGAGCSVGDQLHPTGRLDASTYRVVGEAYAAVEAAEPHCRGAVGVADVGLLSLASLDPGGSRESPADTGACRALLENHVLFDVLDRGMDFAPYRLLILPDAVRVDPALKDKLDDYLTGGGRLLLTGTSGLNDDASASVFDAGADFGGPSPFEPDYLLPIEPLRPTFCDAPTVVYGRGVRMRAAAGSALGDVYDPYFNRTFERFCSHQHTPPRPGPSGFHGGVEHGPITHLAHPLFGVYAAVGQVTLRQHLGRVLHRSLGGRPTVETNLPSTARVVLNRQSAAADEGGGGDRLILHLLHATPVERGGTLDLSGGTTQGRTAIQVIDELTPLHGVEITFRSDPPATRCHAAVAGQDLPVRPVDGGVAVTLPRLLGHEMLVFDPLGRV